MALSQSLVVSMLLHAAVVGAFGLATAMRPEGSLPPPASSAEPNRAAFGGDTFDVEALVDAPSAPRAAAAPASTAASEPAPAPAPAPAAQPKPKPKPKAKPKPKHEPQAPATSSESRPETAATEGTDGDRGASYGAADLPPGVRHLAPAFTRAISAATNRDPYWTKLPIGEIGTARITLDVDGDGRVTRVLREGEPPLAPALERLVERTLPLLRSGRFALSRRAAGAGREILEISVSLNQVEPPEGEWDDSAHTAKMGFVPPEPGKPGRAFFVHGSGLRFDARVSIVSQAAR